MRALKRTLTHTMRRGRASGPSETPLQAPGGRVSRTPRPSPGDVQWRGDTATRPWGVLRPGVLRANASAGWRRRAGRPRRLGPGGKARRPAGGGQAHAGRAARGAGRRLGRAHPVFRPFRRDKVQTSHVVHQRARQNCRRPSTPAEPIWPAASDKPRPGPCRGQAVRTWAWNHHSPLSPRRVLGRSGSWALRLRFK